MISASILFVMPFMDSNLKTRPLALLVNVWSVQPIKCDCRRLVNDVGCWLGWLAHIRLAISYMLINAANPFLCGFAFANDDALHAIYAQLIE